MNVKEFLFEAAPESVQVIAPVDSERYEVYVEVEAEVRGEAFDRPELIGLRGLRWDHLERRLIIELEP